ncbi:MAG: hypothetical protein R6V26_07940 [Roseovarius sp.]
MSFRDLTNRAAAPDKAGTGETPDKATPAEDPANTPERPHPKG